MTFLKPLPRSITRPVSLLLVVSWIVSMAVLIDRTYVRTAAANLATDLALNALDPRMRASSP